MNRTRIDTAKALVRAFLQEPGITKLAFARAAGLKNESVIREIFAEDWNPTADTLEALERAVPADFQRRWLQAQRRERAA